MKDLKKIPIPSSADARQDLLFEITIFEKIAFSDITKAEIIERLDYLRSYAVPNRKILLDLPDSEVVFYWFKQWLHKKLAHYFPPAVKSDPEYLRKQAIHLHENDQANFIYTMQDIEAYIASDNENLETACRYLKYCEDRLLKLSDCGNSDLNIILDSVQQSIDRIQSLMRALK